MKTLPRTCACPTLPARPEIFMFRRILADLRPPARPLQRGLKTSLVLAFVIACLGGFLRFRMIDDLPVDGDEFVYLRAAYLYADLMDEGQWSEVARLTYNREHPPAVKLAYASLLSERDAWDEGVPGEPMPTALREEIMAGRSLSAAAGTVQVFLVALVHPIAGLFLATHTYHTRYTSEMVLDGAAGMWGVLAVVLFGFAWRRDPDAPPSAPIDVRWWALTLSAIALGLTVSSKYMYGLVGGLLFLFVLIRARDWRPMVLFIGVPLLTFALTNPNLWADSGDSLGHAVNFHSRFALEHARPWYHPLGLMTHLVHDDHHPSFFMHLPDQLMGLCALIGLSRIARQRPFWLLWAFCGVTFLLAWPTKWAHYQLLAIPALAMCAGYGVDELVTRIRTLIRSFQASSKA